MTFTKEEIEERGHPVWAEIDLGALKHNVRVLRETAAGAELMAVVKGYAYGHGNPECAQAALDAGATRIGVARVAEAIHLRESGIAAPIHVFTEPPPQAAATLVDLDITAAIYTADFAAVLSDAAAAANKKVPAHVKLDTGMHRVGLLADDVPTVIERIARLPGLELEGVWSHLAVADLPDHPFTRKQLELFDELTGQIARAGIEVPFRHVANSAATLSLPSSHLDLVRCGIAMYGLWPSVHLVGTADLKPVLSLKSRITMSKEVPAGDAISYGLRYELREASRVVTVPTGYADGYDRRLSGRADVLIGGRRYKVSGTVCMDQFMVDVGNDDVQTGRVVTLIGADGNDAITAEELAGLSETINYEITARIPSRVPRVFVDG